MFHRLVRFGRIRIFQMQTCASFHCCDSIDVGGSDPRCREKQSFCFHLHFTCRSKSHFLTPPSANRSFRRRWAPCLRRALYSLPSFSITIVDGVHAIDRCFVAAVARQSRQSDSVLRFFHLGTMIPSIRTLSVWDPRARITTSFRGRSTEFAPQHSPIPRPMSLLHVP